MHVIYNCMISFNLQVKIIAVWMQRIHIRSGSSQLGYDSDTIRIAFKCSVDTPLYIICTPLSYTQYIYTLFTTKHNIVLYMIVQM